MAVILFSDPAVQTDGRRVARLASETDFAGWRAAARALRAAGVAPEDAIWTVDGQGAGRAAGAPSAAVEAPAFTVPRAFMELAAPAVLHRSPERFALLYRLLWRLEREPDLLRDAADPDVAKGRAFAQAGGRAAHQMKAFVDLRRVAEAPETLAAWFSPAHRVTELVAPFFVRRYGQARFSILTPDVCAHWDGAGLTYTPGADPADAPSEAGLAAFWRAHCAALFDRPSRNPQPPGLIPELVESAESRTAAMVSQPPSEPDRRTVRAALRRSRDAAYDEVGPTNLEEVAAGVQACRRCELWREATQGVAGEGPVRARLMLVGEQPGDQEDLAGRPFVGPAGGVLDRALAAAGAPRGEAYVTNAVKHFKHELRGKRRLHKTPDAGEVAACRWWLEHERAIVRPRVIVALGATAALSVFGRPVPIGKSRGQAIQLADQAQGVVTYHPSYLLRIPEADAKAKAFEMFVADLKFAWSLVA